MHQVYFLFFFLDLYKIKNKLNFFFLSILGTVFRSLIPIVAFGLASLFLICIFAISTLTLIGVYRWLKGYQFPQFQLLFEKREDWKTTMKMYFDHKASKRHLSRIRCLGYNHKFCSFITIKDVDDITIFNCNYGTAFRDFSYYISNRMRERFSYRFIMVEIIYDSIFILLAALSEFDTNYILLPSLQTLYFIFILIVLPFSSRVPLWAPFLLTLELWIFHFLISNSVEVGWWLVALFSLILLIILLIEKIWNGSGRHSDERAPLLE